MRAIILWLGAFAGFSAPTWGADFSGIWVPAKETRSTLVPELLTMTDRAKAAYAAFDPNRHDSTRFCMPYGTPRNSLSTAPYPFEILQRPERLTMIFDRLGDVRRVFLDGRERPEILWPTWLGYSVGHWEGETLVIETLALTEESILDDSGLPHSEDMRVVERLSLIDRDGAELLRNEITIIDPAMYGSPIEANRYFQRADGVQMSEGSVGCLMDQWRQSLEERNRELVLGSNASDSDMGRGTE